MAEILLSLTIIGVVAAITLPSLTGNINERTWNTQRKALYARMSQAISLMPALSGYGAENPDTSAETFITAGLAKVLKINNICDNEHLTDCGIVSKYVNMVGSTKTFPKTLTELSPNIFQVGTHCVSRDTKAAAFETANGESIAVYYNSGCRDYQMYAASSDPNREPEYGWGQPMMCVNFIYDLNGSKGPNTVGKDIGFISAIKPVDSQVVAPLPYIQDASTSTPWANAAKSCSLQDSEARIPNLYELMSMVYNKELTGMQSSTNNFWSGSLYSAKYAWDVDVQDGGIAVHIKTDNRSVRCIKR